MIRVSVLGGVTVASGSGRLHGAVLVALGGVGVGGWSSDPGRSDCRVRDELRSTADVGASTRKAEWPQ